MIEIKLTVYHPEEIALLADFTTKLAIWRVEKYEPKAAPSRGNAPEPVEETVARVVEEAAAADEPAPKKRGRPRKEEPVPDATGGPEPVANISATPEDRQLPAEVEEAEIVEEVAPAPAEVTEEDVKDALGELVEKRSMPGAMEWLNGAFGVAKMSQLREAVAEGKFTYAKVVAAIQVELAE